MRKILVIGAAAVVLAGCQTVRDDAALSAAALGAGTGAVIGGLAGGTAGSAVAGGIAGAAVGGLLGASAAPAEPCYVRTHSGRLREVPC